MFAPQYPEPAEDVMDIEDVFADSFVENSLLGLTHLLKKWLEFTEK